MPNFDDTDPPLVDSSGEISPEILNELSAAFGNTPVGAVAPSDPTPVNGAPTPAGEAPPAVSGEQATVPVAIGDTAFRIGSDEDDDDLVYLDDTAMGGTGGVSSRSNESTFAVVAGGFFYRLARRFDPRRKRGRRAIAWVVASFVGAVVAIGVIVVATTPVLSVKTVNIEGATYTNKKTLEKATELLKGKAMLTLNTDPAMKVLESDPWVREVSIDTKLPNTVTIDIAERTPRVWFRSTDEKYRVIDEEGRVLAVTTGQPTGYSEVTGLGPNVAPGGVAPDEYTATAQLSMSMPVELSSRVARFGVTTAGDITMSLQSGALIKFGQPSDLRQKLISVVVVLRRPDADKLVSIDVSARDVVVK